MTEKRCAVCDVVMDYGYRRDAKYCSPTCRNRRARGKDREKIAEQGRIYRMRMRARNIEDQAYLERLRERADMKGIL